MIQKAEAHIRELYLFPYFETREAYQRATGQEPPPFSDEKPPKYWCDPKAAESTKRNVIYPNVIAQHENGNPIRNEQGRPELEALLLLKEEAATVNIPLKKVANEPGAGVPSVPVPIRPLEGDEELHFAQMPGTSEVVVRRPSLWKAEDEARNPLARIEAKLDKLIAKLGV